MWPRLRTTEGTPTSLSPSRTTKTAEGCEVTPGERRFTAVTRPRHDRPFPGGFSCGSAPPAHGATRFGRPAVGPCRRAVRWGRISGDRVAATAGLALEQASEGGRFCIADLGGDGVDRVVGWRSGLASRLHRRRSTSRRSLARRPSRRWSRWGCPTMSSEGSCRRSRTSSTAQPGMSKSC